MECCLKNLSPKPTTNHLLFNEITQRFLRFLKINYHTLSDSIHTTSHFLLSLSTSYCAYVLQVNDIAIIKTIILSVFINYFFCKNIANFAPFFSHYSINNCIFEIHKYKLNLTLHHHDKS